MTPLCAVTDTMEKATDAELKIHTLFIEICAPQLRDVL
jgi:hypothetical protein